MMAKMFYTLDEAKAALGKSEEDIKQFAREGRLREFRDGPRLMFKADQVEALKAEMGGGSGSGLDRVDLGPSDSGITIGLADSAGTKGGSKVGSMSGTRTTITLSDTDGRSPGQGMTLKEDTALAADLGLSGSIGGVPSPGRPSGSGTGLSGHTGSRAGIDVFAADEVERVDPAAQTSISPAVSDQINLEGVGSGSGLLDLTRESDDTSLGAELLDDIDRGGKKSDSKGGSASGTKAGSSAMAGLREPSGGIVRGSMPMYVEASDPMAGAFAGAALGAVAVLMFAAFALISGVVGTHPDILKTVADKGLFVIAGGGAALSVILFVIGLVVGKSGSR